MPTIFRGPYKGYTLTEEDIEWLARSLWGESTNGSDRAHAAVAWTMFRRYMNIKFAWLTMTSTFAGFIRAFSQPVNPAWLLGGSKCPDNSPQGCEKERTDRRVRIQNDPIPEKYLDFARKFADGEIEDSLPVPCYNFRACDGAAKKGSINLEGNCFYPKELLSKSELSAFLDAPIEYGASSNKVLIALGVTGGILAGFLGFLRLKNLI